MAAFKGSAGSSVLLAVNLFRIKIYVSYVLCINSRKIFPRSCKWPCTLKNTCCGGWKISWGRLLLNILLGLRWRFLRSFKSSSLPYTNINFYWLLWDYLLILICLLNPPPNFFFSVIGRCSLVPTSHWLQGKCAKISMSQAASGMILQNPRRLPVSIFSVKIAALGCVKRGYWKEFSKLLSNFKRAS